MTLDFEQYGKNLWYDSTSFTMLNNWVGEWLHSLNRLIRARNVYITSAPLILEQITFY